MSIKLKVGIIGAGEISNFHILMLKEIQNISVSAISDINTERANRMALKYSIDKVYSNHHEMLDKEKLDVVHVLTPPRLHSQMSIDAMLRGCHVLVEKPMALTLSDATKMTDIQRKTGKKLAICEMYNFDPVVVKTRNMIKQGAIGDVLFMENYWFTDVTGDSNAYSLRGGNDGWAYNLPGGVFANFIDHPVYLQREIIGKVETVKVNCMKNGNNPFLPFDELRVQLFAENTNGYIVSSLNGKPRINLLRVYGTQGIITADISNLTVTTSLNRSLPSFLSKGVNNLVQSVQLASDTVTTTASILTKKIAARQGLRTFVKSFYEKMLLIPAPFDDSLIFNCEKALDTVRVLEEIWSSAACAAMSQPSRQKMICINFKDETDKTRKRVLVTGAGGFVGSHLVQALLDKGYIVRVVLRKINKKFENQKDVEVIYGDIRDADCVERAVNGVDMIYHCAFLTTNKGAWSKFEESNIHPTKLLLDCATKYGVQRFIYVSSVAVYGFDKKRGGGTVVENDEYGRGLSFYSYYATSKIEAEKIVWQYSASKKLPVVVVRPGIIFGPNGKNIFGSSRIHFAAKRKILPYVYIKDVISALLIVGHAPKAVGNAYNIVSDEQISHREFRKKIVSVTGKGKKGFYVPLWVMYITSHLLEKMFRRKKSEAGPPFGIYHYRTLVRNLRYGNDKLKNELNWRPQYTLEEGIKETYAYYAAVKN